MLQLEFLSPSTDITCEPWVWSNYVMQQHGEVLPYGTTMFHNANYTNASQSHFSNVGHDQHNVYHNQNTVAHDHHIVGRGPLKLRLMFVRKIADFRPPNGPYPCPGIADFSVRSQPFSVPTRRQTFGEGAWDKVAEMLRTFGVNYRSRKTLEHKALAEQYDYYTDGSI